MEQLRTILLIILITLIFISAGFYLGGNVGAVFALFVVASINLYAYYSSHKQLLDHYEAKEATVDHFINNIVSRLAKKAHIPIPNIYIIDDLVPNSFAVGRNPKNATLVVTSGLIEVLDEDELEGVIAHEISHIKYYDTLIGGMTSTIAGAITWTANKLYFSKLLEKNEDEKLNPLIFIILAIFLPIAAMIIQISVTRQREFMADENGAKLTKKPEFLQSALAKIDNYAHKVALYNATPQSAHIFIINPFSKSKVKFINLFNTHPSTKDRINHLEELKYKL